MRLIQCVISAAGWQNCQYNGARMQLLAKLVELCFHRESKLLVIPAGYLSAPSEAAMPALVAQVAQLANDKGVAIIGGVDVVSTISKHSPENDELVAAGRLPNFGFAVGPIVMEDNNGHPWRQTSNKSDNAHLVAPSSVPGRNRIVSIGGNRVGVLICGELFSYRARNGLAGLSLDLIMDIGHSAMGQGLIPAMQSLYSGAHSSVAHSQHLADWAGRSIHFVNACGEQESQTTDQNRMLWSDGLWAAWSLRELTPTTCQV